MLNSDDEDPSWSPKNWNSSVIYKVDLTQLENSVIHS